MCQYFVFKNPKVASERSMNCIPGQTIQQNKGDLYSSLSKLYQHQADSNTFFRKLKNSLKKQKSKTEIKYCKTDE